MLLRLIFLTVFLTGCTPKPDDPSIDLSADVHQIVSLTNLERKKVNVPPLIINLQLSTEADRYARLMAASGKMSHDLDGTLFARLRRAGYPASAWGENIANGYPTANQVVKAWMESEGHRHNILNPDFKDVGVGVRNKYYCQIFGRR